MTPHELVTDLLVCLQLADNIVNYNEYEAWNNTLTKLFPDHNPGHAEEALKRSFNEIIPDLIKLIEADGIVLSAETDMLKIIEQALNDSTKYHYD